MMRSSSIVLLPFLFILKLGYSESNNTNELPGEIHTYVYQCGAAAIICRIYIRLDCSNITNVKALLIGIKFEEMLGLEKYGIWYCKAHQNASLFRGMNFSKDDVPLTGPNDTSIENLFVISNYTVRKYKGEDSFTRLGCVINPLHDWRYLYVKDENVKKLARKKHNRRKNFPCDHYFEVLKHRDRLAYYGRPPIVLVPGYFSSVIDGRLNNLTFKQIADRRKDYCYSNMETYKIWMEGNNMNRFSKVPWWNVNGATELECWIAYITLYFNETTNRTENFQGVETRVPDWGGTEAVEKFGPKYSFPFETYVYAFYEIVRSAEEWGYKVGESIRGAGYDFRKAPNEAEDYYVRLRHLIEETYELNEQCKVIFICHSMGNMYTLYFLNHMTQEWKDKYIQSFVAMAAPWGGSPLAVNIFIRGQVAKVSELIIPPHVLREAQRTFPSSVFLLPSEKFWDNKTVLASFNGKNYTTADYKEFFQDLNLPDAWRLHQLTEDLIYNLESPGVPVYCIIARGHETANSFSYGNITFENGADIPYPTISYIDGDSMVPINSANGCLQWKTKVKKFKAFYMKGHHIDMLQDDKLIWKIYSILTDEV